MKNRIERINQLIKKIIADILLREIFIQNTLITVQGVDTTKDLKYAKIKVSIMPFNQSEKALNLLRKQTPSIQNKLNSILKIKFVPKIKFEIDKSQEIADRIEGILRKLKQ